jgi:phenylacetate-CoA ligase
MKKATFRGVEFLRRREGEYWQGNPVYNELQFSPFHLNRKTVALYLDKLMEYGPEFLHGYPSAISYLADYVLAASVDVSGMRLKAVLLGSEEVYPEQRAAIEKAFGARAFSWYGHSERVILAGECEKACAYHHFPDYGILEIIGDSGEPVLAEGESGELVGTGLLNRSLPLIRYRTDDRAKRLDCQCVCGRNFERFDNVEGHRKQEFIIGKGGGRMSLASLNIHGPALERVARFQYYQNKIGHMDLRLVVLPGFGEADAAAIKKAFANKLEDELTVRIDVVDDIPLTGRGKLRRLIQEIPAAEMGPTGQ